jgi:lipopolysaccharide transport system ATP-binding protein
MAKEVISVEKVSKRYRIGLKDVGSKTLTQKLIDAIRTPVSNFKRLASLSNFKDDDDSVYWALSDINFKVEEGEVLGIIGKNGAGKSTLLKILSRITEPSSGLIKVKGRVASLLEVGTGFHPELTGRENIYMNGTILGMRKREIDRKFDEIVDFSGVEKFIDTPVKFYSSGMKVRLGFAVAANLDPEVLIIDEVLAVGDVEFQRKCMGKMDEVARKNGRTVLFVSHSMPAVKTLCTKGLLLENGKIKFLGSVPNAINNYFKSNEAAEGSFAPGRFSSEEKVVVSRVSLENQRGEQTEVFQIGDALKVNIWLESAEDYEALSIGIVIKTDSGAVSVANTMIDGCNSGFFKRGDNFVSCTFRRIPLLPQQYHISIAIRASDARTVLTKSKEIGYFAVVTKLKDLGIDSPHADLIAGDSVSPFIPYTWQFNNGATQSFDLLAKVPTNSSMHS